MPLRIRLVYSALTLVSFFIAAVPIYNELTQRSDIWWTPRTMLVPLAQSKDRVEIYARGLPLATLLEAGQLRVAQGDGSVALAASDIGLRFNHWDQVRAQRIPLLLAYAAACGAIALMFLLTLTGRLAYRPEKEKPASH